MEKNKPMSTKLVLNGFTLNPVTHLPFLINVFVGFGQYSKKHKCDTGLDGPIHTNYLGKTIFGPVGIRITDVDNAGSIVQGILENGYYTFRVWDTVYPAKIQFELFLENDLLDIDLIIDHFNAPAIPQDGLGLFDYTYSINKTKEHTSPLQKENIYKNSSYKVNDSIIFNEGGKWEITLNKLKTIECYFCSNPPEYWISFNKKTDDLHINYISVLSCLKHKGHGKTTEDQYNYKDDQHYSTDDQINYVIENIKDDNDKVIFTKNVKVIYD